MLWISITFWSILIVYMTIKSITIVPESYAYVITRLGKYNRTLYSGINFIIPFIDKIEASVEDKHQTLNLRHKETLTLERKITVTFNAMITYKIVSPRKYIFNAPDDVVDKTIRKFSAMFRHMIVRLEDIDNIIKSKEEIPTMIEDDVHLITELAEWGMELVKIDVENIALPDNIKKIYEDKHIAEKQEQANKFLIDSEKYRKVTAAKGMKEAALVLVTDDLSYEKALELVLKNNMIGTYEEAAKNDGANIYMNSVSAGDIEKTLESKDRLHTR